jgi:hypothetical protein
VAAVEGPVGGVGEGGHGRELEVAGPLLRRFGRGSPAGAVVAAVDPDRRQAFTLGRNMVVEQALRDVHQVRTGQAEFAEYGPAKLRRPLVADLPAELLAGTAECRREDFWVPSGRPLALDVRLAVRVSEQQFLIIDVEAFLAGPGAENPDEPGFPVDERAVTVKAEDLVLC